MQANAVLTAADGLASPDLGRLARVFEELRQSLDGTVKTLRWFARDADAVPPSDLAVPDLGPLRSARQQLNQVAQTLQGAGMAAEMRVVRAMEALTERFVQQPQSCNHAATTAIERAAFALTDYLERVLKGRMVSPVALFPQYRTLLELLGADRVHPADLWPFTWRWIDVELPLASDPLVRAVGVQAHFDQSALRLLKSGDLKAARALSDISLGFAAAQSELQARVFWQLGAAFFEALALGLGVQDVHGKRAVSRILLQDRMLARGESVIAERLMLDLLFFCAQAVPRAPADAVVLRAVCQAYGLGQVSTLDYETPQFGRLDPALVRQARKRLALARESWSALAGGDSNDLTLALDQFALLGDSVLKLQPQTADLLQALTRAIEAVERSGEPPAPALAMEVAIALFYLEALHENLDAPDAQSLERGVSLARRLEQVNRGGQSQPLEKWMQAYYRGLGERQVSGSVVDELGKTQAQVEASLQQFFGNPADKLPLQEVPSQLAQMRGMFSVLGLEQAVLAVLAMRTSIEQFLLDEVDVESARGGVFLRLGNSLDSLGLSIGVLAYQRELARKLFAYDDELGEFRCLMGSATTAVSATRSSRVDPALEDQTKVIGTLRIALSLYNVYLNEADEWSRGLITELSEWALELHRPVFDSTIDLAQSLSRASGTVGFVVLADLAGLLEQALRHVQLRLPGSAAQAKVFVETAETIRRLLHQFAAGFLKQPDQALLGTLQEILDAESMVDTRALLAQLGGALRQWTARPDNLGARAEVLRLLQSFADSARLAGAEPLSELAQRMASSIEQLGVESLTSPGLAFLVSHLDALQAGFEGLHRTAAQA
jgi:chemosensory pili system protein ChpA (sensor histidine kinase/response regulator)